MVSLKRRNATALHEVDAANVIDVTGGRYGGTAASCRVPTRIAEMRSARWPLSSGVFKQVVAIAPAWRIADNSAY
jgi:hypothetical protein